MFAVTYIDTGEGKSKKKRIFLVNWLAGFWVVGIVVLLMERFFFREDFLRQ